LHISLANNVLAVPGPPSNKEKAETHEKGKYKEERRQLKVT
jgi:hypothetical protein